MQRQHNTAFPLNSTLIGVSQAKMSLQLLTTAQYNRACSRLIQVRSVLVPPTSRECDKRMQEAPFLPTHKQQSHELHLLALHT